MRNTTITIYQHLWISFGRNSMKQHLPSAVDKKMVSYISEPVPAGHYSWQFLSSIFTIKLGILDFSKTFLVDSWYSESIYEYIKSYWSQWKRIGISLQHVYENQEWQASVIFVQYKWPPQRSYLRSVHWRTHVPENDAWKMEKWTQFTNRNLYSNSIAWNIP